MPPKTNEELIQPMLSKFDVKFFDGSTYGASELFAKELLDLLTEKDKEREEAVAEAYEKGKAEVLAKWVAQEEFDGPRDL